MEPTTENEQIIDPNVVEATIEATTETVIR